MTVHLVGFSLFTQSFSKITVNYIFRDKNSIFPLISVILFVVLASLVALWTKLLPNNRWVPNNCLFPTPAVAWQTEQTEMERKNAGIKDCIYRPVKINTCILNEQTKDMDNCLVHWEIWSLYPAASVLQSDILLLLSLQHSNKI